MRGVRSIFASYLVVIVLGLGYVSALGLMGR